MKVIICFILGLLVLPGCLFQTKEECYVNGYEAAWEEEEPSYFASQDEKNGYKDGLDDFWSYDQGYYDGFNGKKLKYSQDKFYIDGYKDGKRNR
ncbi:MAG: hypothetical protein ACOYT8_00980 [Candidatus Dependentiae bacterium]